MADLKALFAKKATPDGQPIQPNPPVANPASEPAVVSTDTGESGTVQSNPPAATPAHTGTPDSKPAPKRFGVGRASEQPARVDQASSGTGSGSDEPKPGLSALRVSPGASDSDSNSGGVAISALDSLDALGASEDAGVAPRGERVTYFADETPATKPTRELPEGLTKDALGFIDSIDSIYDIIHDPDLLGGVIRNIMIELKSNPEYMKLLSPEDINVMVRGMRESMGLARVKKQETKAKRSSGAGRKSKALDEDIMAGLDDILGGKL